MDRKSFIIIDNTKNVLGVYDTEIFALMNILDLIINQLGLLIKIVQENKNIVPNKNIINNFKIISMCNNSNMILREYHFLLDDLMFCDNEKGQIEPLGDYNYSFVYKKGQIKHLYKQLNDLIGDEKDLQLFIIPNEYAKIDTDAPTCTANNIANIVDTEFINEMENKINKKTNKSSVKRPKPNPLDLKKKIEELNKLKEQEAKKLELLEKQVKKKENELISKKYKHAERKRRLKIHQEKWNEFNNKFKSDKNIYFIMKEQIGKGQLDENKIPELFAKQYPLFKQLDTDNKLNTNEELTAYIDLLSDENKLKLDFVPPSNSYGGLFSNDNISRKTSSDSSSEEDESENDLSYDSDSSSSYAPVENKNEVNACEKDEVINNSDSENTEDDMKLA